LESAISNPKGKRQKAKCEAAMANSMGKFWLGFSEGVVVALLAGAGVPPVPLQLPGSMQI
jgi:hypothetical protein